MHCPICCYTFTRYVTFGCCTFGSLFIYTRSVYTRYTFYVTRFILHLRWLPRSRYVCTLDLLRLDLRLLRLHFTFVTICYVTFVAGWLLRCWLVTFASSIYIWLIYVTVVYVAFGFVVRLRLLITVVGWVTFPRLLRFDSPTFYVVIYVTFGLILHVCYV